MRYIYRFVRRIFNKIVIEPTHKLYNDELHESNGVQPILYLTQFIRIMIIFLHLYKKYIHIFSKLLYKLKVFFFSIL